MAAVSPNVIILLIVVGTLVTRIATRRVGRYTYIGLCVVIGAIVVLGYARALSPPISVALLAATILCIAVAAVDGVAFARTWNARARATEPLLLAPPFRGSWVVAAGGALPGLNHHTIARDQYFAYDFIRRDATTLGSDILAPIAGNVVGASDGMPDRAPSRNPDDPSIRGRELGNFVAIAALRGVVFLCHLQNGSVRVKVGDAVRVGDEIGRCGNSGRTTMPHLHLHAQDLPEYAFNRAYGLPIAFAGPKSPRILQAWSRLKSA
jgi:murein DD-endopeptidase MepM/ murein hydrolase activator NlpD